MARFNEEIKIMYRILTMILIKRIYLHRKERQTTEDKLIIQALLIMMRNK